MVVVQVIGNLQIGGAERLFVNLCNALDVDKVIVVLVGEAAVGLDLRAELRENIELHHIRIRQRSWPRDVWRLARLLRRENSDVVHTHMFWPNLYGSVAARLAGVPIVTSEHGRNEWKRKWHRWLEVNITSRIAYSRLCVSEDILRMRRDVDGIPERLLQLVPNGTVVPPLAEVSRREPIIGTVGRLVTAKDFPTLVKAVAILARRGTSVRLEIVGGGPEQDVIEETIRRENVGSLVSLVGMQTNVSDWLTRWSVFASSSVREGQPVALLEAMAASLPCVVTAVGGVPDTLENGVEGIIVPPSDPEALADGIQKFLDDADLRDACGQSARERVVRDFSIESLASTCQDIYAAASRSADARANG